MPIPNFDKNLRTLPPYVTLDPLPPSNHAPFDCSIAEFGDRFGTGSLRAEIQRNFLEFRAELRGLGVVGIQWIGGSFVTEKRDPEDLDVVTFVAQPTTPHALNAIVAANGGAEAWRKRLWVRNRIDHYFVSLGLPPEKLVAQARYWYACFAHQKYANGKFGIWKGFVSLRLPDPAEPEAPRPQETEV